MNFDTTTANMQFGESLPWIAAWNINYKLGVDGISILFVALTALLTVISIMVSWTAIQDRVREFMIAMLFLEAAMIGVFMSLDLFLFYIFWEAMLIPMYLLIGVWGGPNRLYAAIKFFLYTLVGSVLMLIAIIAVYFAAGHTFDVLAIMNHKFSYTFQMWAFAAFFAAFAVKVPMFPVHTWLPDAHVEAPTAGSIILAGILIKMGAYGFLRFSLPFFPDAAHRLDAGHHGPVRDRHHLRRLHGLCPDGLQEADRLFEREPHGLCHPRHLRPEQPGPGGRHPADAEPRRLDRSAVPCRGRDLRADPHAGDRRLRRHRGQGAGLCHVPDDHHPFVHRPSRARTGSSASSRSCSARSCTTSPMP